MEILKKQGAPTGDALRDIVAFIGLHWAVGRREGVHPAELTPEYVATLIARDTAAFEHRCSGHGVPMAPREEVDAAIVGARRFFRGCVAMGRPPGVL